MGETLHWLHFIDKSTAFFANAFLAPQYELPGSGIVMPFKLYISPMSPKTNQPKKRVKILSKDIENQTVLRAGAHSRHMCD